VRFSCVAGWAIVAVSAVASSARADIYLAAQNGDVVRASIGAPGDVHGYRFDCPAGVVIDVVAKSAKRGPALSLTLIDQFGKQIGSAAALGVVALHVPSPADASFRLQVAAQDGVATGDYVVSLSWKTPQPAPQRVSLAPNVFTGYARFHAWSGDRVAVMVTRALDSKASPYLSSAGGSQFNDFGGGTRRTSFTIDTTGDFDIGIQNSGAPGDAVVSISLRSARRRLSFASAPIPAGVLVVAAGSVAPDATVSLFADPRFPFSLAGCGVHTSRGAVRNRTSMWLGVARDIVPGVPGLKTASPAMFVGPAGLRFRRRRPASVTLYSSCSGGCRVFSRGMDGAVTEIRIVTDGQYVTFPIDGAAAYQVFAPIEPVQGIAVAATDDSVAVGTPGQGIGAYINAGAVTILARNGAAWTQEALLTEDVTTDDDQFGYAVALSGDTLVVGAPRFAQGDDRGSSHDSRGKAFVFVHGTDGQWTQQATLQTTDPAITWDEFGTFVAIDGETIVAGSPGEQRGSAQEGAAYVFDRNGAQWSVSQRLSVPSREVFGTRVAVSGNTLLVGDALGPTAAYVYTRNALGWNQEAQLAPPVGTSSLALDGDTAVLGAQGAAFVFSRSGTTWTQRALLRPQDTGYGYAHYFGASVSAHAGRILVGSPYDSAYGAFLYADDPSGPHFLSVLGSFDKASNRDLGSSVALSASGTTAIVGADDTSRAFEYDVP